MEECACVQRGLTSSGKVKLIKFIGIISPNAPTCLAKSFYVQKGLGPTIYGQLTTNHVFTSAKHYLVHTCLFKRGAYLVSVFLLLLAIDLMLLFFTRTFI